MSWKKKRREQGLDRAQAVTMRGPGAMDLVEGIPLAEYTQGSLQPCVRCGKNPRETIGGTLVNIRIVEQVLVADTLCRDCMSPEEFDTYQAVGDEE